MLGRYEELTFSSPADKKCSYARRVKGRVARQTIEVVEAT